MRAVINNQHQSSRHDFAVGLRNGARRAEAVDAQPISKVSHTSGRVFSLTPVFPADPLGGDSGSRPFIPHCSCRSSRCLSDRRRTRGVSLPLVLGSVATLSRRFISSRLQFRRIGYQPGSYVSDPFESQFRTSFQSRCSDARKHDVKGLAVGQAAFGEKQNAFG